MVTALLNDFIDLLLEVVYGDGCKVDDDIFVLVVCYVSNSSYAIQVDALKETSR